MGQQANRKRDRGVDKSINHRSQRGSQQTRAVGVRHWLALAFLLLLYTGFAVAYSQVMPFNKGPDEGINLDYIEFMAITGRLPVTYDERDEIGPKANWPALYHVMLAWMSRTFDIDMTGPPEIKYFWDSFRYRAIDTQAESVGYLLAEDQEWPYYGRILILHLGRWLSVLFSIGTLLLVYLTILEILPGRPWLAFMGVAILAFLPAFVFISSALNEDALVAVLTALYFWLLVRIIKQPRRTWSYWLIGLAMGLSVTAKYTTTVLPVEVVLALGVITWQYGYSWRWWLQRVAMIAISAILASSWWFGWNLWYLNEVKKLGWVAGLLRPLFTGGTDVTLARLGNLLSGGQIGLATLPENINVGTFPEWLLVTFLSFWGVSIGTIIPLSPYVYVVILLVITVALVGLWRLWRTDTSTRTWLLLMAFHLGLFVILPLVRFSLSRRLGQTAQGRHILIPAATATAVLIVWGVATALPDRRRRWVFSLLVAGLVIWTGVHLYRLDTFSAPLLPMRTLPQAAAWLSQPVNVLFKDPAGGQVELVSYDIDPQPERGLLHLALAWRSVAHTNQSYLLAVNLLNPQGEIVSHWIGYNGHGRLPTLSWDPGDVIFDRLVLPLSGLPAGEYAVQVQLIGQTGALPFNDPQGRNLEENNSQTILSLAQVIIEQPALLPLSRQLKIAGPGATGQQIDFDLWQADGLIETGNESGHSLPTYRYPATISIVTAAESQLRLQLVDPEGRVWPAFQEEGGISTFVIGPRWPTGAYRLQGAWQQSGEILGQVTSGPLLVVENWWKRQFEPPEIAIAADANFANQLSLLGYELPQSQVKAGEAFPLTLYWQSFPDRSPQADFIQFNHLLDEAGVLRGGYDRRPLEYYSTLLWAPGEVVIDGYAVPVDANAPPGKYYLNVGYYLTVGESAVNLPLVVDGQMTGASSVIIGPVEVLAP